MKTPYLIFCALFLSAMGASTVDAASKDKLVASKGETSIAATSGAMNVVVKIHTREVDIGKPSDGKTVDPYSNCTYSKFPCSLTDRIDITVNGTKLFIPRSVFCDLADLSTARISATRKKSTLLLSGGDGSEAYLAKIEFDGTGVQRRSLASEMSPNQPLQETVYHAQTIGD